MQKLIVSHKKIALSTAALIFSLSLLILFIWEFDLAGIRDLFPGDQISNPVTSLCFMTSVISFYLLVDKNQRMHALGKTLAAIVLLVGAIRFLEVIFGFSTGIDRWLFPNKLYVYGNHGKPNFMAPNSAFAFILLGAALVSYRFKQNKKHLLSDSFAVSVALLSFVSLIGYLYGSDEFYIVKTYIPMAFPTALCFFICAGCILLYRSDFGLFSVLTAKYSGSKIARFMIPFAIAIPIFTGLLNIYGVEMKLYPANFGVAFFATVNIVAFIYLIWQCSVYLNSSHKALAQMEEQLRSFNKELEQKVEERTNEVLKNRKRFRALIENSVDMVSIVDKTNRLVYVSPSVERIIGITAEDLIHTPPYSFIHPDYVELMATLSIAVRKQIGSSKTVRLRVRHKNGHYIWIEGTITNLLHDKNVRGVVNNFHDITEQVDAEEQKAILEQRLIEEKINQQKELMRATIDGQEKEKKQIGMELHDHINQILASANIYLSLAAAGKMKEEMIEKGREQISYAISEIRNLSKSLVLHGLEGVGVTEAIKDALDTMGLLSEINCHSSISSVALNKLNQKEQLTVYRIIQEQLNNILKHAKASDVYVTLVEEDGFVQICIEDNGKGFDPSSKRAGIGLSNIKSRVDLLNGKMNIESAVGEGCRLSISFPTQQVTNREAVITTDHLSST